MTPTKQRDHAGKVAKEDTQKAHEIASAIEDPWFKAQALSWVARFSKDQVLDIAKEAAEAAALGEDAYKQAAVRAWEVAALAERDFNSEATTALTAALESSKEVTPQSSRAETLILLLNAALRINTASAKQVIAELESACGDDPFWRCKRAMRDGAALMAGEQKPKKFFW